MRNVSQMLERLVDAADYCRSFGYWQGLKAYVRSTRDLSGHDHDQRATLTLPGIQWPFTVRAASSDLRVLRQVFIDKQYERPGAGSPGLIIDCGANIGLASIFFANAFVASPIYAIEPSNANFELLLENTRPYAQITPIHAAVWSSQCNLAITNPESEYSTFRTVPIAAGAVSGMTVAAVTIDEVLARSGYSRIGLLKLDIEGAEKALFSENCHSWLSRTDTIMIELHDRMLPGCSRSFYGSLLNYSFAQETRGEIVVVDLDPAGRCPKNKTPE